MSEITVTIDKALLDEMRLATQKILSTKKLGDSELSKSVEVVYEKDMFVILANDYFTWVSTGRRPRARKVPVEDLIVWMKSKGIAPRAGSSYNQTAYAIMNGIYKNGIKARNYVDPITDVTSDLAIANIEETLVADIETVIAEDLTLTLGRG